jgi:YVTN family beta-propeller protein
VNVAFDGEYIWVANGQAMANTTGSVSRLRKGDGTAAGSWTVGRNPFGLAIDAAGNVWVTNSSSNSITRLAPAWSAWSSAGAAPSLVYSASTITGLASPAGIAFDGTSMWVANSGNGTLAKYDAVSGTFVASTNVGAQPWAVAFDGTHMWVTNQYSNSVTKLSAADGAVAGTYTVGTYPYGIAFDGVNMWVANYGDNRIMKLRLSDGAVLGTFSVGMGPVGIAFDGVHVWVANQESDTVSKR